MDTFHTVQVTIISLFLRQNQSYSENMSNYMHFSQNSNIFTGMAEIPIGTNISMMVFNWFVLIRSSETYTV